MNWYYKTEAGKFGPFSQDELNALVIRGSVTDETMVWNEVIGKWKSYGEVQGKPSEAASPAALGPSDAPFSSNTANMSYSPPASSTADEGWNPYSYLDELPAGTGPESEAAAILPTARCTECGKDFPEEDLLKYGSARVCASCKPLFFQKLKEGVPDAVEMQYAGFWIRVLAKIIDGLVAAFVIIIPKGLLLFYTMTGSANPMTIGFLTLAEGLFELSFSIFYETFFVGRFGATPGKMVLKLKVVRPDGSRVTYLRAFGRMAAAAGMVFVPAIILGVLIAIAAAGSKVITMLLVLVGIPCMAAGYLMVAFDSEKRGLHDRICSTRVIRVSPSI